MQTGSDSIELLTALTERDLRFRSDAKVTEHAIAPVDTALLDAYAAIDRKTLRHYRLERIREQLRARDYAGILLADPINIRYATDTNNLGLWVMHSPSRYVFVATDGPVVLFEFTSSRHNSEHVETIDEIRPAIPWLYFLAGPRVQEKAERWAQEVADLMARYAGGNRRLAVDRCDPWGAQRLTQQGIELFDAQPLMEQARLIKSAEEVASHRVSMGVCDLAIARMRTSLVPGVTENQLWSIMHGTNVAHGGEWAESRLLSSGPRTNPWFQDATDKVIKQVKWSASTPTWSDPAVTFQTSRAASSAPARRQPWPNATCSTSPRSRSITTSSCCAQACPFASLPNTAGRCPSALSTTAT